MSNILIINGVKKFVYFNGQLNDILIEVVDGLLCDLGYQVKIVCVDSDYDIKEEVQNFVWVDVVIWQMSGWWMGVLWIVKKYMDDVFIEGYGMFYVSDGCMCFDVVKKYGFGGLVQGKKYMLLLMWNVLMEVFIEKDQFFYGVGVDGVYLLFYKVNQFLGMDVLLMFIVNDVIKMLDVLCYIVEYCKYLSEIFV